MKHWALLTLLAASCFREAKPCDGRTLEQIIETCPSEAECIEQIEERERLCEDRMRRGD